MNPRQNLNTFYFIFISEIESGWVAVLTDSQIASCNSQLAIFRGQLINQHLYQGKEYRTEDGLNLYDFHARQYDPALGRFLAVDPAGQFSNPYLGMGNNPVVGVDPDGRLVWAFPTVSWSKDGGFSLGFVAGVGIPGVASAQIGGGYNFKSDEGYGFVAASAGFNTVSLSYSPSGGWNAGYSFGLSPYSGVPISTNFFTVGVNFNISNNQWGGNLSAWQVDQQGNWNFNPSVSMMIYPEQSTNLIRGQGFRSNDKVLAGFVNDGNHQGALDYFGFKGTYKAQKGAGGEYISGNDYAGSTNSKTGKISYGNLAFDSYDKLLATYVKERFHSVRVKRGKQLATQEVVAGQGKYFPEEVLGYKHAYKNQGLYRNSQIRFLAIIENYQGQFAYNPGVYYTSKGWHIIYKIPRLY